MSPSDHSPGGIIGPIRALLKRFRRDDSAVAAVEAAMLFPIMISLYFGSLEASRAIAYDRRITSAAATLGDLVSRVKTSLTEDQLDDYFVAAAYTMIPYSSNTLKQIVTCVYVDEDGAATVSWSYGYNGGVAHTEGATYDLPTEFTDIASDSYVIVAETSIHYDTLVGMFFSGGLDLYKERLYVPRFGEFIDVTES